MKPVTIHQIHPFSLLAGAALLAVVMFATGAVQPTRTKPIEVVGIPDPRDMVVIRDGVPLSLSDGKLFVLTALGFSKFVNNPPYYDGSCSISADGVYGPTVQYNRLEGQWANPINFGTSSVVSVPTWVVHGPSKIQVTSQGFGRAWGYVIDESPAAPSEWPGTDPLRFAGVHDPRDFFSFYSPGHQFTIPPGKLFVIDAGSPIVDGVQEVDGRGRTLSLGLTVHAGSVIEGDASGFLIDDPKREFVRRP